MTWSIVISRLLHLNVVSCGHHYVSTIMKVLTCRVELENPSNFETESNLSSELEYPSNFETEGNFKPDDSTLIYDKSSRETVSVQQDEKSEETYRFAVSSWR